jgi:hypothetical protein
MNRGWLSSQHNASAVGAEPTHITITHPHHPLNGQKLELISVRRGPNSVLLVKMLNGVRARLPRDWTDYGCSSLDEASTDPAQFLSIEGLRKIIKIISQGD